MSNTPTLTSPVYAHDEDILVHAGGDFAALAPAWQQLAAGVDGVFDPADRWTLTSASCDFQAQGVTPNHVILLTAPKAHFPGGGHFLAVESVGAGSVTLRRPYKSPGVGQPPSPATGLTSVAFSACTLDPQIGQASYDIKQRFGIADDPANNPAVNRASSNIFDMQVLRIATVYWVLLERYEQETRSERGDFAEKAKRFRQKLDDALSRVQIRWGNAIQSGGMDEPLTLFSCKISR